MRIKIGIALITSFIVSSIISNELFIAQTPHLRSNLGKYFAGKIIGFTDNLISLIPFHSQVRTASGIYTKSDSNQDFTIVREKEVEWQEYTFVIKGKTVKVKVPKGEPPPTKEMVEKVGL